MVRSKVALNPVLLWACRIILIVYAILVASSYWSMLTDIETTKRLVGSDVGCSLSAVDCNWLYFGLDKLVGTAVIAVACIASCATKWHLRDRALVIAALAAVTHLVVLQAILNPS